MVYNTYVRWSGGLPSLYVQQSANQSGASCQVARCCISMLEHMTWPLQQASGNILPGHSATPTGARVTVMHWIMSFMWCFECACSTSIRKCFSVPFTSLGGDTRANLPATPDATSQAKPALVLWNGASYDDTSRSTFLLLSVKILACTIMSYCGPNELAGCRVAATVIS